MGGTLLNRTCLKSSYSLRRQLIVSYGSTAFVTIAFVVVLASLAAKRAGNIVSDEITQMLDKQIMSSIGDTEVETVKIVTQKFKTIKGSSALLSEIIRDRIVGYPDEFVDDRNVPFEDIETLRNRYPLDGEQLPRDFEITSNITPENIEEHLQERAEALFADIGSLSTESAVFIYQGNCDPEETNIRAPAYLDNCTAANNDPQNGGVVHPVATLAGLAEKANDIGIFLKPLFEAEQSVIQTSVYFFNSGAGATLAYPAFRITSTDFYISAGCNWMREINPLTGLPYGGAEEIARCNPEGSSVNLRNYNPMEQEFCRDQALNPGKIRIFGPYKDKIWGDWRINVGQAVFDRKTGEFIACTGHELNSKLFSDLLKVAALDGRTEIGIARLDGTFVGGWGLDLTDNDEEDDRPGNIVQTGFLSQQDYNELTNDNFWEKNIWDPIEVQSLIRNNFVNRDGGAIAAIPLPVPPSQYTSDYEPNFIIFLRVKVEDVIGVVNDIDENIQDEVGDLILNSVLIGIAGLIVFLVVVACVSHIITRPLSWMEETAWKIVNHTDWKVSKDLSVGDGPEQTDDPLVRCSPKTEIGELVTEFQVMIRGFSGTGASRVAPKKIEEIKNFITWKEDFRQFYQLNQTMEERIQEEMSQKAQSYGKRIMIGKRSRTTSSYGPTASEIIANMSEASQVSEDESTLRSLDRSRQTGPYKSFGRTDSSTMFKRPLTRTNLRSNLPLQRTLSEMNQVNENVRMSHSRLFRWILCSIVLPLLITNLILTAIVASNLLDSFPDSVDTADEFSFDVGLAFLHYTGKLHALHGSNILPGSLRDLHVLNRISGWLLFDAIGQSDAFSDLEVPMVEECKGYGIDEVCPFDADPSRSPCDCAWNDPWNRECDDFSVRTRRLQKMWFLCQARDFDPETGNRETSISFPEFDFNPMSTKWWTEVDELPGSEKGVNASGYETTYDRVRVASAIQAISLPLYNYVNIDGYEGTRTSFSSYVAYEGDGGYLGYAGCNYDASRYAQFKSSDENGAYRINPELCPVGKYGYDPRCRGWYAETKRRAIWQDSFVHMTVPYKFANVNDIGSTAGSGLIDPRTGEFVGTTAIDLSPASMFASFENLAADFYFIVSSEAGNDALVGPGHDVNSSPENIGNVVLPYDDETSENYRKFTEIVAEMKAGESGSKAFTRKSLNGQTDELYVAYSPIRARAMKATQADDFKRGIETSDPVFYSVGVVKSRSTLERRFKATEEEIGSLMETTAIVFVCLVAAVTFICIFVTAKISTAVAKPMLILLRVVQRVNAGRIEDDMPPLQGGSREITQVYSSFAKLYKIVRMSNASFFSGDFKWAHHIADDALKLFRKIGDKKAVAIACNNIGNTIVALSVQRREKSAYLKEDVGSLRIQAMKYFDEAIEIGTQEFEASDEDGKKAEFAQQLADRHFNRAMCLLHFLDDDSTSSTAKENAFMDLYRCKEYDRGVQEFLLHEKLMFKFSNTVFERLLRRIHGLSFLYGTDSTVWQVWDVNDLVEQADLMLQAAWDQEKAPLFENVGRVGRLQQLEGAVVGLELISGKTEEASQLAMRMLVEDEYILDSSFVIAADAVLRLMKEPQLTWSREAKLRTSLEFRRMRRAGKRTALDIERCFVFCIELGEKLDGSPELAKVNAEVMAFYEEQCNLKDTVGLVAMSDSSSNNLIVNLGSKETVDAEQREALEIATTKVCGSKSNPPLAKAVDMVVSPSRSRTSDVFLIYISSGSVCDAQSFSAMIKKVRDASGKRTASINVISVGVEVEDESFAQQCRNLCLATRSRNSQYLSVSESSIEDVFENVTELVSSTSSTESNRMQLGITMERF